MVLLLLFLFIWTLLYVYCNLFILWNVLNQIIITNMFFLCQIILFKILVAPANYFVDCLACSKKKLTQFLFYWITVTQHYTSYKSSTLFLNLHNLLSLFRNATNSNSNRTITKRSTDRNLISEVLKY